MRAHLVHARRLAARAVVGATVASCAGAAPTEPPLPHEAPRPLDSPPPAAVDAGVRDVASSIDDGDAGPPASSPPAPRTSATACPEDMALVDGDYCTNLQVRCLKSHYAKQNKKTICEEFAEPTVCVGAKVKKRYCIDRYEFPNKKGHKPEVMNDFPAAQKKCASLGKRVCTESEWTMACEGPSYKPYPYGYTRNPSACRGDRPYRFPGKMADGLLLTHSKDRRKAQAELDRLWDGVPSGSQPECVSDYGVFDMPGNADELAASEGRTNVDGTMKMPDGHVETLRAASKYDNVTTGGPWVDGVRNQCRPKIYTHNEGFSYYYLSFRCCAEPDGNPTDPRSPRQVARGERWRN